jgi:pimeloyl-ACP methyl ester carboxylesterase
MIRVRSGDVELAVEVSGQGPPLLFAHGLSANRGVTLEELSPLADRFRVIAFDQRGHGDSTPIIDPRLYDPDAMAQDMEAILDHLRIESATVGGESMGAATALLFARARPERVEALLLVAPAFGAEPNPDRRRLRGLADEIDSEGFEGFLANSAQRLSTRFGAPPEVVRYIGAMHRTHRPESLSTAFRTVPDWIVSEDVSALVSRRTPVGLVAWEGDPTHPMALARRLAAAAANHSRLEEIASPLALFADPPIVGRTLAKLLDMLDRTPSPGRRGAA